MDNYDDLLDSRAINFIIFFMKADKPDKDGSDIKKYHSHQSIVIARYQLFKASFESGYLA
jgi:hypothetical protein